MENPVGLLKFGSKKTLPAIRQSESSECSLACLAMVANYYGHQIDLTTLRRDYPLTIKGVTLQSVIQMADSLHFSARPMKVELEHMNQLDVPCILHWDMSHFVVLKKVTAKGIVVHDPELGERSYDFAQASKYFTGIALELTPTKSFVKKVEESKLNLSDLWTRIVGLKSSLIQILTLSLLLQMFAIATPFYIQLVVDDVTSSKDYDLLMTLALGFLLLMLVGAVVSALRSLTILYLGSQISIQIASNLFRRLIKLPMEWFEKRHIGDVVARFGSLDKVKELLTTGVITAIVDGIMMIGTMAMMFLYSPTLTTIVLITSFLYLGWRLILYRPLKQRTEDNIISMAREDSNFMETVRAAQSVKLFGRESQRQAVWQNLYAQAMNCNIRLGRLDITYMTIKTILFGIENIIVIYLAAQATMEGLISIGMLFAFLAYKEQFTTKAVSLIDNIIEIKMISLYLRRISDIALTPIENDLGDGEFNGEFHGKIELKGLAYRYSNYDPYIFENTNITIEAGESIAIIGGSGCGKTTLAKVMLGLLAPQKGQVFIDGLDTRKIGLRCYRNQIAAVMQDDQLLSGSIDDNICFFEPNFDQAKIERCARLAAIHDTIMEMPMGYNSLIGDMGTSLSGGQKQRIILARALYKNPKVLFLDEATSNLDVHLEKHVNVSVSKLNMTRIIIAHRPETIRSADRIVRLHNGQLTEVDKSTI
jgi:ATP-binding cassette subfamily B protein RaxB